MAFALSVFETKKWKLFLFKQIHRPNLSEEDKVDLHFVLKMYGTVIHLYIIFQNKIKIHHR